MRTAVATLVALLVALTLPPVHARAEGAVPAQPGTPQANSQHAEGLISQPQPPVPAATTEPPEDADAEESVSPSASPSPATRRPVDDEGDLWVNLALIGGIGLIGTVVVLLIAGGILRRRSRRRQ